MGVGKGPDLEIEMGLGYPSRIIIGVDEVGRGCLAGPVVAAAVALPTSIDFESTPWLKEIRDSKLLPEKSRERLAPLIESWASAHAVGIASVSEIDRINIFHAAHLAMSRAIETLCERLASSSTPIHILIDGKFLPKNLMHPATAVIKGDLRCLSVACASIIAKVWRDKHMAELSERFPGYGFEVHKGYSTPKHKLALEQKGVTDEHRRSFSPVAKAAQISPEVAKLQEMNLPLLSS